MKRFEKRQIENFELSNDYYIESWINGNKSHVKQELAELFLNSPIIALRIINDLPKDISTSVIDSEQMKEAGFKLNLASLGQKVF